jgi:hypothetical protein
MFTSPFYAILSITKLELITLIVGAGAVVPSVIPLTALTDKLKQHPLGTVIIAVLVTFPYSSTACGVKIALEVGLGSPFTAIATAIGVPATPPSGVEMFPLNVTLYLAKQLFVLPFKEKIPSPEL